MTKRQKPKRPPLPSKGGSYVSDGADKLERVAFTELDSERRTKPATSPRAAPAAAKAALKGN